MARAHSLGDRCAGVFVAGDAVCIRLGRAIRRRSMRWPQKSPQAAGRKWMPLTADEAGALWLGVRDFVGSTRRRCLQTIAPHSEGLPGSVEHARHRRCCGCTSAQAVPWGLFSMAEILCRGSTGCLRRAWVGSHDFSRRSPVWAGQRVLDAIAGAVKAAFDPDALFLQ